MKKRLFSIVLAVMMLAVTLTLLIPVSSTATTLEPSKYVVYASDYVKANPSALTATTGWADLGLDQGVTSGGAASGLQKVYSEDNCATFLWRKYYDKGICAHASSKVTIKIEGQNFARFTADAGGNYADGSVGNTSYFSYANACYLVEIKTADGTVKEVFKADNVPGCADIVPVDVAIPSDAVELILTTSAGINGNNSDHTAWFDAKFYLAEDPADDYFVYASDFYKEHADLNDGVVSATTGWGSIGIDKGVNNSGNLCSASSRLITNSLGKGKGWPLAYDASSGKYTENKNSITAVYYDKGIAAHSNSSITFNLEGQNFAKFQADLGMNYSGNSYSDHSNSVFAVIVTDAEGSETVAFKSPSLTMFDPALPISVDIPEGSKSITLTTTHDGDNYTSHAAWFDAKFVYNDTAHSIPAGISAEADTVLLTEGNTARITTSMVAITGLKQTVSAGVQYTVSDPTVLSVSEDGIVSPLASGKASVTVSYGGYSDTVELIVIASGSSTTAWSATSPDGSLTVALFTDEDGVPVYYAVKDGQLVMNASALGMKTSVGDFSTGLTFSSFTTERQENRYTALSGKASSIDQPGNITTVTFEKGDYYFDIILAAFDEGFAYRYGIDAKDGSTGSMTVSEEVSSFSFFEDTVLWTQKIDSSLYTESANHQAYCYESAYNAATAAKDLTVDSYHAMPALAKVRSDCYLLISEADLYGDRYAGSCFKAVGDSTFKLNWAPMVYSGESVSTSYAFTSPYRMVIVGTLGEVVESTLTETLNPPAEGDYSWVEPGYTAWMWLTEGAAGQHDPDTIKEYIDLASEMGWNYLVLDDYWQPSHFDPYSGYYTHTEEVVAYAAEKNVGLIAWFYSPAVKTNEDGSYDLSFLEEYKNLGMVGVKADFFDSETPDTLSLYKAIYEKCAELQLIVNCHGANKPTGESRTYPHVINREAAKTREYGAIYASDVTVWAFARNVVGAVDATPSITPASMTSAGMVANFVLLESGMPCVVASPEQMHASGAYNFLKNMPAAWDETRYVDGYPGNYAVLARRSADTWYLGGVTTGARSLTPDLSFLGEGSYTAILMKDNGRNDMVTLEAMTVTKESVLTVDMIGSSGFAVKFIPSDQVVDVDSITFSEEHYLIKEGTEQEITATVGPLNASFAAVTYSSSNTDVATVDAATGKVTALKPGHTVIRVSSVLNEEIYGECTVYVYDDGYALNPLWSVVNENADKPVVADASTNSLTMPALIGDLNAATKPQNIWLIEAEDGFEITVKVTGGLKSNYETVSLCAFDDFGNIVIMSRRFHSYLGNNIFCLATHDGSYHEKCASDPQSSDEAYLKLTLSDGVFTGYYSYDGETWTAISETVSNAAVSGSENLRVGLYFATGSFTVNSTVTFTDFSYNGTVIPFYTNDITPELLSVEQVGKATLLVGKDGQTVDVMKYYSDGQMVYEEVTVDDAALAELQPGENTLKVTVDGMECVLTFTLLEYHPYDLDEDGAINISDVTLLLDFLAGASLSGTVNADINGDEAFNIGDVTALLDYLSVN